MPSANVQTVNLQRLIKQREDTLTALYQINHKIEEAAYCNHLEPLETIPSDASSFGDKRDSMTVGAFNDYSHFRFEIRRDNYVTEVCCKPETFRRFVAHCITLVAKMKGNNESQD